MVSDKPGARVESKLPDLFANAETLAAEVHAEHERDANSWTARWTATLSDGRRLASTSWWCRNQQLWRER